MKSIEIDKYITLVFDCDGVILNSNDIKTKAFYETTKHFGHKYAKILTDYHIEHGGISRYKKFTYFLTDILYMDFDHKIFTELLDKFSEHIIDGLLNCEIALGLNELRHKTKKANWLIVSGGSQNELRYVFRKRNLDVFFDGGIFGSPDEKKEIINREISKQNIKQPALYLGDSRYDHHISAEANIDFIFISQWTELKEWEEYISTNRLLSIHSIENLTKL